MEIGGNAIKNKDIIGTVTSVIKTIGDINEAENVFKLVTQAYPDLKEPIINELVNFNPKFAKLDSDFTELYSSGDIQKYSLYLMAPIASIAKSEPYDIFVYFKKRETVTNDRD